MSFTLFNGSTLTRLVLLALMLAGTTLGFCSMMKIPTGTRWRAPNATTGSASHVLVREEDEWLPVSLGCRRISRFGS